MEPGKKSKGKTCLVSSGKASSSICHPSYLWQEETESGSGGSGERRNCTERRNIHPQNQPVPKILGD